MTSIHTTTPKNQAAAEDYLASIIARLEKVGMAHLATPRIVEITDVNFLRYTLEVPVALGTKAVLTTADGHTWKTWWLTWRTGAPAVGDLCTVETIPGTKREFITPLPNFKRGEEAWYAEKR